MIVFTDLLSCLQVLEPYEGEFSRLPCFVPADLAVCNLIGIGLEVLLDLFLSERFGDVFYYDSAHLFE